MSTSDEKIQRYLDELRFSREESEPHSLEDAIGKKSRAATEASVEMELYRVLYDALAAEPDGTLPSDFAQRVAAIAMPEPARRWAIEEILSPLIGTGALVYAGAAVLTSPSGVGTVAEAIVRQPAIPFIAGTAAAFALVWLADKRLMPAELEKLRGLGRGF